ncbi:DNA-(apurinic or apyrimidinic site) endonuclease 2-like isoform X1 [Myxocyprinus asiaticus]|uniref:DNA-(apurinic or apyrimidinic site) endonuclease 2-like isoform X1 n=1 Tax=Myxocyprinus asiaticus TaxID=70543 RepID=UPI002223B7BA|nr:DNA-(apurinic or apyrimidinic site) endonuclease 2-like isoform X1 [Myxocyprinus asiaticus]
MVTSGADGPEKLTVSNVYCPHADLDKLERKQYKLQFYRLLQVRAEAILSSGSHVIVLGDVNTSHQPIDHCEPNDVVPGRPTTAHVSTTSFPTALWSKLLLLERTLCVEGSNHCPVWAQLICTLLPSPKCPPLCTRHMPEFTGRQQKLLRFFVRFSEKQNISKDSEESLPGSQDCEEIRENLNPLVQGENVAKKRSTDKEAETTAHKAKRSTQTKTESKPKGSLLAFFKPTQTQLNLSLKQVESSEHGRGTESSGCQITNTGLTDETDCNTMHHSGMHKEMHLSLGAKTENQDEVEEESTPVHMSKDCNKGLSSGFWKLVLHGPPQPLPCKSHNEPCVLRTVK